MNLSSRGRYATRAMIELARLNSDKPIPLSTIASCQEISRKYLQQLMSHLRRAGLVRVMKGNKGGFLLARPPEEITIAHILTAVEGELEITDCVVSDGICNRTGDCQARKIWTAASRAMIQYLDSVTLASVVKKEGFQL